MHILANSLVRGHVYVTLYNHINPWTNLHGAKGQAKVASHTNLTEVTKCPNVSEPGWTI